MKRAAVLLLLAALTSATACCLFTPGVRYIRDGDLAGADEPEYEFYEGAFAETGNHINVRAVWNHNYEWTPWIMARHSDGTTGVVTYARDQVSWFLLAIEWLVLFAIAIFPSSGIVLLGSAAGRTLKSAGPSE